MSWSVIEDERIEASVAEAEVAIPVLQLVESFILRNSELRRLLEEAGGGDVVIALTAATCELAGSLRLWRYQLKEAGKGGGGA